MKKIISILFIVFASSTSFFGRNALAAGECPDGQSWDTSERKCIDTLSSENSDTTMNAYTTDPGAEKGSKLVVGK